jgi:hypothetical protein
MVLAAIARLQLAGAAGLGPVFALALRTGIPAPALALGFGVLILGWYFGGNELMRRRGRRLAFWCKQAAEPMGGTLAIRWLTHGSFQIEVADPEPPFRFGSLTGLVESLDVPTIWLWNRWRGRRDMILLQLTLQQRPIWGLELYRPRSLLAGDAKHRARQEGWEDEELDGFRLASAAGAAPRDLAARLLAVLGAEGDQLVRIAIRRQGTHISLAMNVPDVRRFQPSVFHDMVREMVRITLSFATPAG